VLEDGVTVDDTAHDINAPVGAGVLGNVNQVAPKGGLPPF
jgi:F0F1-type ATP synthase beta subunit